MLNISSSRRHSLHGSLPWLIILGWMLAMPGLVGAAVVDVDLPACMPLTRTITIDGNLSDWQGVEAYHYLPLKAFGSGDMSGNRRDIGASVRFGYDARALYVAIGWLSPLPPGNTATAANPALWHQGGDGLELHLDIDGVVEHIASFPAADGHAVLMLRRGGSPSWSDLAALGGQAAIAVTAPGRTYGQELRIPWRLLSSSAAAPTGRHLRFMLDLAWKALPGSVLTTLGEGIRLSATDVSYNVLTSADMLFSRGYLPSAQDWGEIRFAGKPAPAAVEEVSLGSGITAMTAALAAKPPVIDGSINAWPAASLVSTAYGPDFIGDRFACTLGAQYDANNLYLIGRFASPIPPLNPEAEHAQEGFKGGDCLQVRLARGRDIINLCAWYDSRNHAPALTADGKELPTPLLLRRGAQLRVVPRKHGYVMEMALPWRLIFPHQAPPSIGERMRCTFQPWWSGTDPRFTLSGKLSLERRGVLAVSYTMPRDADLSMGIFTADGALLRTLVKDGFRHAGLNTEYWDGHDQDGNPIAAGTYKLKALYHDPISTEYLMTVGNPGNPPWPSVDGKGDWIGDESNVQAAATDGKWVFLASPGSEKGLSVIGIDGKGQRRWAVGSDLYPRSVALAVQGAYLYVLYSGPEMTDNSGHFNGRNAQGRAVLRCFDKRTGQAARFTIARPTLKIATFPYIENMVGLWNFWTTKSFDPDTYGGLPRYGDCDFGEVSEAMGLAVTSKTVYIALHTGNRLAAFDAVTGEPRPDLDVPLAKPVSLQELSDQALLAVSGKQVVRIDLATRSVTPVITSGLVAPFGVTTDKAGEILVSDWGDSFQVKVFSPTGRPRRAIGRPGGRRFIGRWQSDGMLLPRGIAVTDAGRLWVAEDDTTPRRVSVWNVDSGAFIRDYIGPTPYGGGSAVWFDPKDPTEMHTLGCRFKLDFATKSWLPQAIETRRLSLDQPFDLNGARSTDGVRILWHGKDEFVAMTVDPYLTIFLRRKGDIWVPSAALGCLHRWATNDGTGAMIWDSDLYSHLIKNMRPGFFRGHIGDNFAWSDRNGDGLVEADEMIWKKTIFRGDLYHPGLQMEDGVGWGMTPSPDWTMPFGGICKVANGDDRVLFTVKPRGWCASGAPIYDLDDAHEFATGLDVESVYGDDQGHILALGGEGGGHDPITCYDEATGKKLWRMAGVPQQGPKDVRATGISGEFTIPALGHMVGTWQWHGNWRPYLVTTDGLYVGSVQKDGKLGPAGMWDESYRYYAQMPDGTPLLINGANDAQHILRIRGLGHGGRFGSGLTISDADVKLAKSAIRDDISAIHAHEQPPLVMAWLDHAPKIDGDLGDWDTGRGETIDSGKGRKATVVLGRDGKNLYLAYHVVEADPLRNQGSNWQTLFLSGDCVDLMLSTDPKADPHQAAATVGDLRLLLGVFQGKPIAVLYRPVVPGTTTSIQLMAARFDSIERLADATVAIQRGDGYYNIEASMPLKALGLDPSTTEALRGDVGVIYADATGRDRGQRSYYYNRKTGLTADLTTEANLQPGEWGRIILPLGRNLLKNGGFETPLADKPEHGWFLAEQVNGMGAAPAVKAAHSGRRGLLVRQVRPVVYTDAALKNPDYDVFARSANGGKGGGQVTLRQRVPVQAGKAYSLRFFHRADGMKGGEQKGPGPGRGYSTLSVWIQWEGGHGGQTWVCNLQDDTPGWVETFDARFNDYGVPKPYIAPPGATSALLSFYFTDNAARITPTFRLDDVEFVPAGDQGP